MSPIADGSAAIDVLASQPSVARPSGDLTRLGQNNGGITGPMLVYR